MRRTPMSTALATALVGAAALCTTATHAEPAAACRRAPEVHGYTVARVASVSLDAPGRSLLALDRGTSDGLRDGQHAYLVDCAGERTWALRDTMELHGVVAGGATAVLGGRHPELAGRFVAVDTGYPSRAPHVAGVPAGGIVVELMSVVPHGDERRVGYVAGADDGVMPGDRGWVVDDDGNPYRRGEIVVDEVGAKSAFTTTSLLRTEMDAHRYAVIVTSGKTCAAGTADPEWRTSDLVHDRPPRGYAIASVTACQDDGNGVHTITLDRGSARGTLPGAKALVLAGPAVLPAQVHVDRVGKDSAIVSVRGLAPNSCNVLHRVMVAEGACR